MTELLLKIGIFVVLFLVGWGFGRYNERKHWAQLAVDEAAFAHIRIDSRRFEIRDTHGQLVTSTVVIAQDYFKWVLASIRNVLGGRITTYETLLDRARREAIVRLKKQTAAAGAVEILGVRLDVSDVGADKGSIEVLAYGTMIFPNKLERPWPPRADLPPPLPRI
ncbi:MAG: heavy metal-binding domain-containing protein [Pseudomonadota bacterium]|nr:heavy metal-binding domain-containing protein [Pseudomonadota bacterium]